LSGSNCTSSAADRHNLGGPLVRRWCAALLLIVLVAYSASPAHAQPAAGAPSVSTEELQALVRTLEDDEARAEFIQKLKAIVEAQRSVRGTEAAISDNWLAQFSGQLRAAVGSVAALGTGINIPRFANWLRDRVNDPGSRQRGFEDLVKIIAILVAGVLAHIVVTLMLIRPRRAIEQRTYPSPWLRGLFAVLRFSIDFLPLAIGMGVALATAGFIEPRPVTRLIALAFVNGMVASEALMMVARLILQPRTPNLRLLRLSEETAHYLYIWISRIGYVALYGYFMLEAGLLMGLPRPAYGALGNVLGMIIALLLIIFVLQNRESVASNIRGAADTPQHLGALRRPLAAVWHLLAIFYVVALYLVLALRGNAGTIYIMRGTVITAVVLGIAWALNSAVQSITRRGLNVADDVQARFPGLQSRLNRYTTAINVLVRWVIGLVGTAVILEAWGVEVFAWVGSPLGQRVVSSAVSIVIIIALALVTWELASSLIERRLTVTSSGRSLSTRALTLLPLARTALRVALVIMVTMVVLSELGVNIAPLLAGAGVVGLAVGFGAQKLVQDVITGWFILMEDTIAVGDVVDVEGHAGLVERINIRTLQLRDFDGAVHTIPFSSVTKVKNMTRDFSYYVFEIGVGYGEDTDHVIQILREIDEEMRADPKYAALILEPLDISGVDRFDESAVVIKARIKTRPIQQWTVGREFNRRIKRAFDAKGIEIPFPQRTLHLVGDKRQARAFGEALGIDQEEADDNAAPPAKENEEGT
jgi:small conductance mechanosensitive channel